jgi:hypothetical protein
LQVGVVRGNKADLVPIQLGHDYGVEVEVVSGITGKDDVIVNPPDSLVSGTTVRITEPPAAGSAQAR